MYNGVWSLLLRPKLSDRMCCDVSPSPICILFSIIARPNSIVRARSHARLRTACCAIDHGLKTKTRSKYFIHNLHCI
jgi:hypothetical protein